jgi:hypothetical protein
MFVLPKKKKKTKCQLLYCFTTLSCPSVALPFRPASLMHFERVFFWEFEDEFEDFFELKIDV